MTLYYSIIGISIKQVDNICAFKRTLSCDLAQDAGEALQQVADVDAAAQTKPAVRWKLLHCHGVRADERGRQNSIPHVSSRHD